MAEALITYLEYLYPPVVVEGKKHKVLAIGSDNEAMVLIAMHIRGIRNS